MVADKIFDLNVSSKLVYQSDIPIKGKTFVKVFIDRAGEGTWEVIDGNDYQLINDSLVFTERPTGSLLIMQVATTPSELQQTPTDISLLLTIKGEIKTLVASLGELSVVSESVDKVKVVADNIIPLSSIYTNIVPNLTEILQSDTNAKKASTSAEQALGYRNEAEAFSISNVFIVNTIEDLVTIPSNYTTAIVKDLNRGGTFVWSATGTANGGTVFAGVSGYWNRQYDGAVNVKWFGAKGDEVTDDTIAIKSAISSMLSYGKLYFPKGTYICRDELLVTLPSITFEGEGKGYYRWHFMDPLQDIPETRILFKGTGAKSIKTRVKYRESSLSENDSPISTALNIQNDGFKINNMTIELYCDYLDTSSTNFGDDWDVGIFVGSRLGFEAVDVNVIGYWRTDSILIDSTRGVNLPELNGYPHTEGAGSDGASLVRVLTCGGYWGVSHIGPLPKKGLMHFGFQYKRGAKFEFIANPLDGETITIGTETFTYRGTPKTRLDIGIGASITDTIDNTISVWRTQDGRLVPYDELTLYNNGYLEVYSTTTVATALSSTSLNINVLDFNGLVTTETKIISDPAPFYDEDTDTTYDDGRNSLGGSDFVVDNCVIYSIEHHSGSAITTMSGDALNDTSAGRLRLDGLGGTALMHRQFINNTRIHSREPYNVKLGFIGRYREFDCTHDGDSRNKYASVVASEYKSALLHIIGYDEPGANFPLYIYGNQLYTDYYMQGYDLFVKNSAEIARNMDVGSENTGTETGFVRIRSGKGANAEIRLGNEVVNTVSMLKVSTGGGITWSTSPSGDGNLANCIYMSLSTFLHYASPRPATDNTLSSGTASNRWSVVYAGTGTINTSDEREKTFSDIPEVEMQVAKELKSLVRRFKFNDAIEAKGIDNARIHYGTSAQEVIEVFKKYGLDAMQYAMVCYDEWEEEPEIVDDEGNVTQEYRPAGNRYGIRYEELIMFILGAV